MTKSDEKEKNSFSFFYVSFSSLKNPAFFSCKQNIKAFQGVDLVLSQNSFQNCHS